MFRWITKQCERTLQVHYETHPGITPGPVCDWAGKACPEDGCLPPPDWGPRQKGMWKRAVSGSIHVSLLPVRGCHVTCCLRSCGCVSHTRVDPPTMSWKKPFHSEGFVNYFVIAMRKYKIEYINIKLFQALKKINILSKFLIKDKKKVKISNFPWRLSRWSHAKTSSRIGGTLSAFWGSSSAHGTSIKCF